MKTRILILIFSFIYSLSICQDTLPQKGAAGLSATFQGQQLGLLIPIWTGNNFVIAPAIDFAYAESAATEIGIGIRARYYITKAKVSPYIGIGGGAIINSYETVTYNEYSSNTEKEKTFDFLVGLAFGGEYFLDEHFSFGIEAQGNMTKSDKDSYKFGNPDGINFNLATMLSATIYF